MNRAFQCTGRTEFKVLESLGRGCKNRKMPACKEPGVWAGEEGVAGD